METILNFLSAHYPTIAMLIVGALVGSFVTKYHLSIQSTKKKVDVLEQKSDTLPCIDHSQRLNDHSLKVEALEQKADALPCIDHSHRLNDHIQKVEALEQKTDTLPCIDHSYRLNDHSQKIDGIRDILIDAFGKKKKLQISMFSKLSPYTLSENGQKFLANSGGKECIDTNLDFFIMELEKIQPQTAYDVEIYSERVLFRNTDSIIFKKIKDYVYVAPRMTIDDESIDISLSDVISVMRIYLRDKYLDLHPELIPEIKLS